MTLRSLTLWFLLALCSISAAAQSSKQYLVSPDTAKAATTAAETSAKPNQPSVPSSGVGEPSDVSIPKSASPQFRVERLPIASGGELLTIFGRLDGMKDSNGSSAEVPLISVV